MSKKLLALLLTLLMLVAVVPAVAQTTSQPFSITVFHTNDVHANANPSPGMGYAMMAAYVEQGKKEADHVLLFDAGDTFHGTVFATAVEGASIAQVLNNVGYTAMTPGNHDFNYGYDRLKELEESLVFPLVNCNIYLKDGTPAFTPYTIVEVEEKKIGVIGVATAEMVPKIHPDRIKDLDFRDGVEAVTAVVEQIKDETDAIILLSHWGITGEETTSEVLGEIEGIDLIIDGHSHDAWPEGHKTQGPLIVSAGEKLSHLGKAVLTFGEEGVVEVEASLLPSPTIFEDRAVIGLLNEITAQQDILLNEVIGKTAVLLDGERANARTKETNLGDLAADAFIAFTDADVAITNGGGIRASIEIGDITLRDTVTVFPFGNLIVTKEVKGADIRAALEHGLRMYPDQNGGFPQIGGMTVSFDPAKEEGSRVVEVLVGSAPLEDEKAYVLATNDFMAAGGDGYEMFMQYPIIKEFGGMDEAIKNYIASLGEEVAI
ncbi:MAG: bifunctional metallophosphatase/5'-nucleotidase, partial [Clostridiales bacterium]|nr:bifunctional metallophosphatase/5'-nucleotidase [Clostridiales bacterium]